MYLLCNCSSCIRTVINNEFTPQLNALESSCLFFFVSGTDWPPEPGSIGSADIE